MAVVWYNACMTPKLTEEQRLALRDSPGRPVPVEDDRTHEVYFLVERDQMRQLLDEQLRRELQVGFDEADRGEVVEWDAEKIKAEGRKILEERSQQA